MTSDDQNLFVPACSITMTKRRRFFWAAWWTKAPSYVPFTRPDASNGGLSSRDDALREAELEAGVRLVEIDPLWARAWIRVLRGEPPWPSKASREPTTRAPRGSGAPNPSVWELLGVTPDVTESELKAAFRRRVLEVHPDQGGTDLELRRVVRAYEEAARRQRAPKPKKRTSR